jgi:lipoyl(octanoyl) transferase
VFGADPSRVLQAYLLGALEFERAVLLQRRLAYEATGETPAPAVVLCDHPPLITVGRHGSRAHIRLSDDELAARRWEVRWVARGGGVQLHGPGQVACYPVLPLRELDLTPAAYVDRLCTLVAELCRVFGLRATIDATSAAVRVNGRLVAAIGVGVRNSVASFGTVINVNPDLALFRGIACDGDPVPMTSLQRECPTPVRPQAVRQRLLELLADRFGFDRTSVFHQHPMFLPRVARHAVAPRPREAR